MGKPVKEGELSTCDREALHLIPFVQCVGAVVVVDVAEGPGFGQVLACSANAKEIGLEAPDTLIGSRFEKLWRDQENGVAFLQNAINQWDLICSDFKERDGDLDDGLLTNAGIERFTEFCNMSCTDARSVSQLTALSRGELVYMSGAVKMQGNRRVVVIDVEPADITTLEPYTSCELMEAIGRLAASLSNLHTEGGLCARVAEVSQETSDYDRVMVYKFDAEFHGCVIAEHESPDLDVEKYPGYLGHKFPATDIPVQARALYVRNKIRGISSVEDEPVPLIPCQIDGVPIDMTDSRLRYPSKMHVKYLKNMGVMSSASSSIVVDGKLWGLIACHNYGEKHVLTAFRRMQLRTIADFMQNALASELNRKREDLRTQLQAQTAIFESLQTPRVDNMIQSLCCSLLDLLKVDALVVASYKVTDHNDDSEQMDTLNANVEKPISEEASKSSPALELESLKAYGQSVDIQFVYTAAMHMCSVHSSKISMGDPISSCLAEDWAQLWSSYNHQEGNILPCGLVVARCVAFDLIFVRHEKRKNTGDTSDSEGDNKTDIEAPSVASLGPEMSSAIYNHKVELRAPTWTSLEIEGIQHVRLKLLSYAERVHVTNSRLAKKMAELTKTIITQLQHDVRTPFSGILSMLNALLQDKSLTQHAKVLLEIANKSAQSVLDVLDDLLTTTKLEDGRLSLSNKVFSPADVMHEVSALVQSRVSELGVSYEENAWMLEGTAFLGDSDRVKQVLLNLAGCALQSIPSSNGMVTLQGTVCNSFEHLFRGIAQNYQRHSAHSHSLEEIKTALEPKANAPGVQWLFLTVGCNGSGLGSNGIKRLFRLNESTVVEKGEEVGPLRAQDSTLAVSYKLCKMMCGTMWCFSNTPGSESATLASTNNKPGGISYQFALPVLPGTLAENVPIKRTRSAE